MTVMLFLSLLIPLLAGLLLTVLCFPPRRFDTVTGLFHLSLGAGIGLGVLSCLYFLTMLPSDAGVLIWLDPALAILLVALAVFLHKRRFFQRKGILLPEESITYRRRWIFPALFTGTLVSALASVIIAFLKDPHGKWDAWMIWNLHARFILRGGQHWQDYLTGGIDWTHPDYPLLTPLSIVRMWKYAGSETVYGPFFLSILFMLAVAGLLVFSLAILRSRSQGCLAGLVLMGSPYFLDMASFQFADIQMSFFFLATLIIFFLHDRFSDGQDRLLILAGLTAALAAWTKNEGLLFLLIVLLSRFAFALRIHGKSMALRQTGWFIAGALPVLLVIAIFKIRMTPTTDLFAGQDLPQMIDRMTDPQRYGQIVLTYLQTALTFTQGVVNIRTGFRFHPGTPGIALLSVYMILMGIRTQVQERPAFRTAIAVVILMLAGYFGIYLITPYDLHWHLLTSLNRLFLQLWPAVIFLCFVITLSPEQALAHRTVKAANRHLSGPEVSGETRRKNARRQKRRRGELA